MGQGGMGRGLHGQGGTYGERVAWDREVRMGRGLHGTGRYGERMSLHSKEVMHEMDEVPY